MNARTIAIASQVANRVAWSNDVPPFMKVKGPKARPGKFKVELRAEPSDDFDSGWASEVRVPRKFVDVSSLQHASRACERFISQYNLSGSNFYGGATYDDTGTLVAHVSYNGRIWDAMTGKELR